MMEQHSQEVEHALHALRAGGTICYPTDTVWGIGCDATQAEAVVKVLKIKPTGTREGLIVLLHDINQILDYVKEVPDIGWDLLEASGDPVTIIYPGGLKVAPGVLANDGSIAIRLVKDPFCVALLRKLRKPLVSTSANLPGAKPPSYAEQISPEIAANVDYIVKIDSVSSFPKPSPIIKLLLNGEFRIIRK
ncbi:MAG: Sua5/YciO/YrdC/YwlC family protein [Bacteroidetes bacterium]|nr:Sua5/YciO/YrdC/YwlC family protein [Bacteroidota bacterium]